MFTNTISNKLSINAIIIIILLIRSWKRWPLQLPQRGQHGTGPGRQDGQLHQVEYAHSQKFIGSGTYRPVNPYVRLLVGWLNCRSVCLNFRDVTLPCSFGAFKKMPLSENNRHPGI